MWLVGAGPVMTPIMHLGYLHGYHGYLYPRGKDGNEGEKLGFQVEVPTVLYELAK